jgi:hypothetical protein
MEQFPSDGETGSMPAPSSSPETLDASFETGSSDHRPLRLTGRVGRAIPGAIAGVLLIGAIAFGATAARPDAGDPSGAKAAGAQTGTAAGNGSSTKDSPGSGYTGNGYEDGAEPTDGPGGGTEPTEKPDPTAKPEPTEKPDPTKEPEPTEKPDSESMNLVLSLTDGGGVKVDWTRCYNDGAVAYKVVRTIDGSIKWPFGGADHQIALIQDLAKTAFVDNDAPGGKTLAYRVFCVGGHDGGWKLLNRTPARSIHVPGDEPTPKPEPTATPQTMSLHLSASEAGGVYIDWSACESDWFTAYKVVRSSDEATKWPLGDNDTLVTYISDRENTHFVDTSVEAGGRYFYRVFCVKATEGGYKVLNSTHVEDFTVPVD